MHTTMLLSKMVCIRFSQLLRPIARKLACN